jgi:hypothetical protein
MHALGCMASVLYLRASPVHSCHVSYNLLKSKSTPVVSKLCAMAALDVRQQVVAAGTCPRVCAHGQKLE